MKKWNCNYILENKLTDEQLDFFDKHGVIIFRNFLNQEKVQLYLSELTRLEKEWLSEGKDKVNGIPLKFGKDMEGNKTIQRYCFASLYSNALHDLLDDERLQALTAFLAPYEGRIGENEIYIFCTVVRNHNLFKSIVTFRDTQILL